MVFIYINTCILHTFDHFYITGMTFLTLLIRLPKSLFWVIRQVYCECRTSCWLATVTFLIILQYLIIINISQTPGSKTCIETFYLQFIRFPRISKCWRTFVQTKTSRQELAAKDILDICSQKSTAIKVVARGYLQAVLWDIDMVL